MDISNPVINVSILQESSLENTSTENLNLVGKDKNVPGLLP